MHYSFSNKKRYFFTAIGLCLWSLLAVSCKKDQIETARVTQVTTPSAADLNKILFTSKDEGYIVGGLRYEQSDILHTTDGGNTWSLFHMDGDGKKAIYGLAANNGNIYGVGFDGKIFIKNDAGMATWRYVQTSWWEWFQDITFPETGKGFIVAGNAYNNGRILRTDGAGNILSVDSFEYELTAIGFASPAVGYACGFGAVLKTSNGGGTWVLQQARGDYFKSVSVLDEQHVWIAGYNGSIICTRDGGASWQRLRNGDDPLLKRYRLRAILFKDAHTGYAAGDKGLLLKTEDGGLHWMELKPFTGSDLRCLAFHPDGSLWTAGTEGVVFHIRE